MLKKTALAVLALSSSAVFAGTMGPVCKASNVTVPCEEKLWGIGGHALYVQPTSSAMQAQRNIVTSTANYNRGVNPTWAWGFQLETYYNYSAGKDVNLNWYHLRQSGSYTATPNANLGTVVFPNDPNQLNAVTTNTNEVVNSAYDSVSNSWDQVNIEFGQRVDFFEDAYARFHGGAEFASVGQGTNATSNGTYTNNGNQTFNYADRYNAVYNGFGPRVGADLNYSLFQDFKLYADGAVGLLAGTSKTSLGVGVKNRTLNYTVINYSNGNVVPALDAKLGMTYDYKVMNGDLALDAGWVWAQYIGALSVSGTTSGVGNANIGFQGVYFGLKWLGASFI